MSKKKEYDSGHQWRIQSFLYISIRDVCLYVERILGDHVKFLRLAVLFYHGKILASSVNC